MRMPSEKTLIESFGDAGRVVRRILKRGSDFAIEVSPQAQRFYRACYGGPRLAQLRLLAINEALGGHGVESIPTTKDEYATYINMGDVYHTTIIRWRGQFRVSDLASFIETMERRGVRFE